MIKIMLSIMTAGLCCSCSSPRQSVMTMQEARKLPDDISEKELRAKFGPPKRVAGANGSFLHYGLASESFDFPKDAEMIFVYDKGLPVGSYTSEDMLDLEEEALYEKIRKGNAQQDN